MRQSDKVQLVLIETKNPSVISKGLKIPSLFYCPNNERYDDNAEAYQNLYALSNEKPKDGDWVIFRGEPRRVVDSSDWRIPMGLMIYHDYKHYRLSNEDKKIILATDTKLGLDEINQEFILHYITEYNKDKVIHTCNKSQL